MIKVSFDSNFLRSFLRRAPSQSSIIIGKALDDRAQDIQQEIDSIWGGGGLLTRYKTGKLVKSIQWTRQDKRRKFSRSVYTDVPYSPYVEFDTRPHPIYPRKKKALRFLWKGKLTFAKRVWHPGTTGVPAFQMAARKFLPGLPGWLGNQLIDWVEKNSPFRES